MMGMNAARVKASAETSLGKIASTEQQLENTRVLKTGANAHKTRPAILSMDQARLASKQSLVSRAARLHHMLLQWPSGRSLGALVDLRGYGCALCQKRFQPSG
jgi:hypothetical protein